MRKQTAIKQNRTQQIRAVCFLTYSNKFIFNSTQHRPRCHQTRNQTVFTTRSRNESVTSKHVCANCAHTHQHTRQEPSNCMDKHAAGQSDATGSGLLPTTFTQSASRRPTVSLPRTCGSIAHRVKSCPNVEGRIAIKNTWCLKLSCLLTV